MSDPQTIVARLYEAFGRGDLETVFSTIGDDIVWHLPGPEMVIPYAGIRHGRDEAVAYLQIIVQSLEFLEFKVDRLIADGEHVVTLGRSRVRARPTGKEAAYHWATYCRVSDGKVQEYRVYEDTAAIVEAFQRESERGSRSLEREAVN